MYHNKSFYLGYQSENNLFLPNVISAFKILVDENYFYFMDDEEHNLYPKGTVAFIRCTAGNGKIYTKHGEFELSENDYISTILSNTRLWGNFGDTVGLTLHITAAKILFLAK